MTSLIIGNAKHKSNCIRILIFVFCATFSLKPVAADEITNSLIIDLQPKILVAGQWGILIIDQISNDENGMISLKERGSLETRALYGKKIDIVDTLGATSQWKHHVQVYLIKPQGSNALTLTPDDFNNIKGRLKKEFTISYERN